MAWNEPGGNKDKDPWGQKGADQGPPDLDEAFRKLQSQLAGIFGGRTGNSGGGSGSASVNPRTLLIVLLVAVVIYVLSGLYQIDQQERGVVFRFGAVKDEVVMPGLHWYPRFIDTVETVNVTRVNSIKHQALMLTQDENIVDVTLTVQWVIDNPIDFATKVRDPENSLENAAESALRHVVGSTQMDDVITEGRAAIAVEVGERLQTYLNRYGTGILVSKANIDQSVPPKQVQDAFDDVQRAKEDQQRVINEATAYRESVVPEARGDAQKEMLQAEAYRDQVTARAEGETRRFNKLLAEYRLAKQVTRDRLYIDALESVLSHTTKILVDVKGVEQHAVSAARQADAADGNAVAAGYRCREYADRRHTQRPRCDAANQPLTGADMRNLVFLVIGVLVLLLALDGVYEVKQTERAVLLRFGAVERADVQPGLHFKWPIADSVKITDARVLTLDSQAERYYTLEKKPLIVDSFVKWRVADVATFYTATSFDERQAERLLSERVNEGLRNQISRRTMHEVISGARDELMKELTESLDRSCAATSAWKCSTCA